MRIITVQPAAFVDNLFQYDDGTSSEGYRLPYPFHVDKDGRIQRQDFWQGKVARVIGFVADSARQEVDLWWPDAWKDPQKAVGMYVITEDSKGGMATHMTAIESMTVHGDKGGEP